MSEFVVAGTVVEGDHRGRALGFPTANVFPGSATELPEDGVYGGTVIRANGTRHLAAISVGRRPTYYREDGDRLVEAYLLDFEGDLYGETIRVNIEYPLRGQVAFSSSEELVAQIAADVAKVRERS